MSFQLSCESTVDMPYRDIAARDISVIFFTYQIDGEEFPDDMGRDPEALPCFYRALSEGRFPTTSQINTFRYEEYLESLLQKGDVLHIAFTSGMSASVNNAITTADKLRARYPERKLIVIDSLCASSGYGLLVDTAADLRDAGRSLEEVAEWVSENRTRIHHQFFTTDLQYFKRSGRVSGAAATLASILSICPIMRVSRDGRILAYDKVRGKNNAIRETLRVMEAHAEGGTDYRGKCFICHSNCLEDAEKTRNAILSRFPNIREVRIFDVGTIVAAHSGPGTVAVFFFGDEREE